MTDERAARHCWLRLRWHDLGEWHDVPGVGTWADCKRCGRQIQTGSHSRPIGMPPTPATHDDIRRLERRLDRLEDGTE